MTGCVMSRSTGTVGWLSSGTGPNRSGTGQVFQRHGLREAGAVVDGQQHVDAAGFQRFAVSRSRASEYRNSTSR
jgi:hypothetical protein